MEQQPDIAGLRTEGINVVSSFMGHMAVGTEEELTAAKDQIGNLSFEGLQAAESHLRMCLSGLDGPDMLAMLPSQERCAFRAQRMLAIMTTFDVVSAALDRHYP